MISINGMVYLDISENYYNLCYSVIKKHKTEFDTYKSNREKLLAVKKLKDYTSGGLRESKEFIDAFWDGKIKIPTIKEDRKEKLERLAKKPLVNEIVLKILNKNKDELTTTFMKLTLDDLLSLDDYLSELQN